MQAAPARDYSKLDTVTVGFVSGDGIGPVIMKEARRLLGLED